MWCDFLGSHVPSWITSSQCHQESIHNLKWPQIEALIPWGLLTHASVKLATMGSFNGLLPSYYLHHCWVIDNWTSDKHQWNLNRNITIFIQDNQFENVVWKMAAILFRHQCVTSPHVISLPTACAVITRPSIYTTKWTALAAHGTWFGRHVGSGKLKKLPWWPTVGRFNIKTPFYQYRIPIIQMRRSQAVSSL